jgi:hypothetical protein
MLLVLVNDLERSERQEKIIMEAQFVKVPAGHPTHNSIVSIVTLQYTTMSIFTLTAVLEYLKKFLEEEFVCPICLEFCTATHINPDCNHRFCGKCIKESLRKCNKECPSCRVPIPTHRTCRGDPQFDRLVSNRVVLLRQQAIRASLLILLLHYYV